MTTKEMISDWFDELKKIGYSHMLVVCDSFDYTDCPIGVVEGEDINKIIKHYEREDMQRIMEIYDLNKEKESQLNEERARNI